MYGGGGRMPMPMPSPAVDTATRYPMGPSHGPFGTNRTENQFESDMLTLISDLKALIAIADNKELEDLNNDETKLISLIEDSKQVKSVTTRRSELEAEIRDLATMNLSLKPDLQIKKDNLATVSQKQGALKEEYDKLQAQARSMSSNYSLEDILAKLKVVTSQIEEETEELAQSMLNKDIEMDEFLEKYIPKRAQYHARRTKSEKMSEMILQNASPRYYGGAYGRY